MISQYAVQAESGFPFITEEQLRTLLKHKDLDEPTVGGAADAADSDPEATAHTLAENETLRQEMKMQLMKSYFPDWNHRQAVKALKKARTHLDGNAVATLYLPFLLMIGLGCAFI